jgi:hypothetical protein
MHHSNTTLLQNEYRFILLHVSIHNESSSGICTKPLKHSISSGLSFYFLLTFFYICFHIVLFYTVTMHMQTAHAICKAMLLSPLLLSAAVLPSLNWLFISFHSHCITVLHYIDLSVPIQPIWNSNAEIILYMPINVLGSFYSVRQFFFLLLLF